MEFPNHMNMNDLQLKGQVSCRNPAEFDDMFVRNDNGRLKIRRDIVWEDHNGVAYWACQTGLDGGKLVEKINTYKVGKGKRTPFEQAVSECESKREKAKKGKYYRTGRKNAIHPTEYPYPPQMLAQPHTELKKGKKKIVAPITYPCFAQRKLDGNRSFCKIIVGEDGKVHMWSRRGNFFDGLPHIEAKLREMAEIARGAYPDQFGEQIIFDGELYTMEFKFEILNGVLNRKGDDPDKLKMQLWMYDLGMDKTPQDKRAQIATRICELAGVVHGSIKTRAEHHPVVFEPYEWIENEQQLLEFHKRTVQDGFEGTIIRLTKGAYLWGKRSKELIKYKDFYDAEYEVVDMIENDKLPGTGKFVCKFVNEETGEQDTFEAMPAGSMEERMEMWQNREQHIGTQVNIRYLETFDTGKPRFGVARLRNDK